MCKRNQKEIISPEMKYSVKDIRARSDSWLFRHCGKSVISMITVLRVL